MRGCCGWLCGAWDCRRCDGGGLGCNNALPALHRWRRQLVLLAGTCCHAAHNLRLHCPLPSDIMAADEAAAKMAELKVQEEDWTKARVVEHAPYFQRRVALFNQYKARQDAALQAAKAANVPIKVVLPDGAGACQGELWVAG